MLVKYIHESLTDLRNDTDRKEIPENKIRKK